MGAGGKPPRSPGKAPPRERINRALDGTVLRTDFHRGFVTTRWHTGDDSKQEAKPKGIWARRRIRRNE